MAGIGFELKKLFDTGLIEEEEYKAKKKEILDAIIKLVDEKIIYIRKSYCPKCVYRCEQNLKEKTKVAEKYDVEFYNYETNETLGGLRIVVKNIEEIKNDN